MNARISTAGRLEGGWAPLALRVAGEIGLVVAAAAFLALTARIRVDLPFTPVPVTGQTLGVLLVGALYGPRRGALAVAAYVGQGVAGLPVFAGGAGGPAVLLGPTGGYLLGFVPAAAVAGLAGGYRRGWQRFPVFLLAGVVVYAAGVPWLAVVSGAGLLPAAGAGALPFLPGDVLKAGLAAGVVPAGAHLLGRLGVRPR